MQMKMFYVYDHENQAVQEAYTMLTTNLRISNNKRVPKTFVLLSCNPEEGKTSLAINLAISISELGLKVLLVDADMRKPSAMKRLNQGSLYGLSNYLMGEVDLSDALCQTNIANLTYLSCGKDHLNPMSLLSSTHFEILVNNVRSDYDIVLFDTPALASVADGSLIASHVEGALLVVKMGSTRLTSLKRIREQLENLNVNILGVVLNNVKKHDYKLYVGSYDYYSNAKRLLYKKKMKIIDLPTDG